MTSLNLREGIYVYGGTALGVVAPILYNRYIGFSDVSDGSWAESVITAIPLSIVGAGVGFVVGISAAAASRTYAVFKLNTKNKSRADDLEGRINPRK